MYNMDIQRVKLIAVDMDGTLLNSRKELPPDFYTVFDKLRKRNILFAIASGRQYYNLVSEVAPVKEDIIFIAENGSYVAHDHKEILVQPLNLQKAHELISIARTIKDVDIILCGKKQAYIESDAPGFLEHVNMYYNRRVRVEDLLKVEDDEVLKIALCDFGGSEQNSYTHFKHMENEIQVTVSGTLWLDIADKSANKGIALKAIQQMYNIGYDETMVFGDYMNDLEMMKKGYFSYAMANAHPEVKAAANFITGSNDDNGVMKVVAEMV